MTSVRRAVVGDAEALGRVHAASWRATYAHLGDEFLASIVDDERVALWNRILGDGTVAFVAGDPVVGFVNIVPSRDDDATTTTGEVASIYCAPDAWGTGAGRALMAVAIEELRAMGFTEATLWVLDHNPRARRFYEIAGWSADGATKRETWRGVELDEVRYRVSL